MIWKACCSFVGLQGCVCHNDWLITHMQVNVQDIVGSMNADKQNLRMEELDLLFQEPNFN